MWSLYDTLSPTPLENYVTPYHYSSPTMYNFSYMDPDTEEQCSDSSIQQGKSRKKKSYINLILLLQLNYQCMQGNSCRGIYCEFRSFNTPPHTVLKFINKKYAILRPFNPFLMQFCMIYTPAYLTQRSSNTSMSWPH